MLKLLQGVLGLIDKDEHMAFSNKINNAISDAEVRLDDWAARCARWALCGIIAKMGCSMQILRRHLPFLVLLLAI